jgi:hypothetical protein
MRVDMMVTEFGGGPVFVVAVVFEVGVGGKVYVKVGPVGDAKEADEKR